MSISPEKNSKVGRNPSRSLITVGARLLVPETDIEGLGFTKEEVSEAMHLAQVTPIVQNGTRLFTRADGERILHAFCGPNIQIAHLAFRFRDEAEWWTPEDEFCEGGERDHD